MPRRKKRVQKKPVELNMKPNGLKMIGQDAGLQGKCPCDSNSIDQIKCHGNKSGLLLGTEIRKFKIIDCDDIDADPDKCFQDTSYDLRLGEGHFVYSEEKKDWDAIYIGKDIAKANEISDLPFHRQNVKRSQTLEIPPFGCAFIQLYETIDTCSIALNNRLIVAGRFDLKLSMVRKGLTSQQATQVEPGYNGKLFCYLFNNTGSDVLLEYKNKIATIEFCYSSCNTMCDDDLYNRLIDNFKAKNESRYTGIYCTKKGISDVRFFSDGVGERSLPKHGGLSFFYSKFTENKKLKEEMYQYVNERFTKKLRCFLGFLLTVIALLAAVLAIPLISEPVSETTKKINQIKEDKKQIASDIKHIEERIDEMNIKISISQILNEHRATSRKK